MRSESAMAPSPSSAPDCSIRKSVNLSIAIRAVCTARSDREGVTAWQEACREVLTTEHPFDYDVGPNRCSTCGKLVKANGADETNGS